MVRQAGALGSPDAEPSLALPALLLLLREVESDDMTEVIDLFVTTFGDDLLPYCAELAQAMVRTNAILSPVSLAGRRDSHWCVLASRRQRFWPCWTMTRTRMVMCTRSWLQRAA